MISVTTIELYGMLNIDKSAATTDDQFWGAFFSMKPDWSTIFCKFGSYKDASFRTYNTYRGRWV